MIHILAVVFMLAGVVFLFAAIFGLLRFADPLQRIHATTKSGTVGAGLILVGVMLHMGDGQATFIGTATVIFLMLTIPIASHLLGRAAYISGARLDGLHGEDALKGVLERNPLTLDECLEQNDQRRPADHR
ncbi:MULTISPECIES: monovalent cation/H(+) antiporter subunit G [Stutzerimonas stutzeri subgroup]|uniref:Potassium:proton antiporter n=1 Tax=Stutzerimonas stutzeri TaxID=316 RepID=A0A2N8R9K9_STUST|nr:MULTISPECIES: monovalent cation/H(+) antiporter subunit G [Stutzerimonas stutzeri subgroup]MDH2248103.1 monovalent cation/H(+) antiporter subunit G [Pseudomonas sp. GD03856]MDH2266893.1 monovalent cation/H(+) antiporter subunit G [Pseudomonas sp. GD03855]OCX91667.1 MAG: potassium:proton antiporter [Pseudomonas sp. CO183]MBA1239710.1 monovalent cation/H(+) antiporter subunit G [Stutzerimonas kunmingensis]MCQ4256142.1 monovalent cation/H(+) antiporter subunit G [Stutzerimonas stutzeri]